MGAAAGDIGEFYGLPTQCGVNASGAKEPGWQTAMEDVTTTFVSMMAGVDMLTGVGMVAGGRVFSYSEMLLGAEIAGLARALASGATDRTSVAARLELSRRRLQGGARQSTPTRRRGRRKGSATSLPTHVPPRLDEALDEELRRLVDGGGYSGAFAAPRDGEGVPACLSHRCAGVRVPHDDSRRLRLTSGRDIDPVGSQGFITGSSSRRGPGGGIATKARIMKKGKALMAAAVLASVAGSAVALGGCSLSPGHEQLAQGGGEHHRADPRPRAEGGGGEDRANRADRRRQRCRLPAAELRRGRQARRLRRRCGREGRRAARRAAQVRPPGVGGGAGGPQGGQLRRLDRLDDAHGRPPEAGGHGRPLLLRAEPGRGEPGLCASHHRRCAERRAPRRRRGHDLPDLPAGGGRGGDRDLRHLCQARCAPSSRVASTAS